MNSKVTVSVDISQFPTDVLITELYNRIYDDMNDEEPRYDPLLNNLTPNDKIKVLGVIGWLKNDR